MSDKIIAIAGYSGHGFVVAEAAFSAGIKLTHYTDKKRSKLNPYRMKYLGLESNLDLLDKSRNIEFILGTGNNAIRNKIYQLLTSKNIDILNVLHNSSLVSDNVTLGSGNFISKNVVINPLVQIGNACIINTGAIVEHECMIGDVVHIAPGAVLAGNVTIGNGSFIGANSVIRENVTIGRNVIIGAGAVVVKDVLDNSIMVGNPAGNI